MFSTFQNDSRYAMRTLTRRNDETAASVRVDALGWVDYLHLGRWNDQWKIISVFWDLRS